MWGDRHRSHSAISGGLQNTLILLALCWMALINQQVQADSLFDHIFLLEDADDVHEFFSAKTRNALVILYSHRDQNVIDGGDRDDGPAGREQKLAGRQRCRGACCLVCVGCAE